MSYRAWRTVDRPHRLAPRQRIEERGFACVRVAHERDRQRAVTLALAALRAMLALQLREARLEHLDTVADEPPVRLELRFAGPAQADTAFLPLEVSPGAHEARCDVLQLSKLHLQLALVAAGALGEDVENQACPIDHAPIKRPLQIALLCRCERMVEDDDFDVVRLAGEAQLLGLAAADEQRGIGAGPAPRQHHGGMGARALREQAEFFETGFEVDLAEIDADERCVDQIGGRQIGGAGTAARCKCRHAVRNDGFRTSRRPDGN